jgi:hypothetical protein
MKRLDREGMYTIPIWFGLFFTGVYVLWTPRADPVISEQLEDRLAVAVIVGSMLCLIGAAISDRITAYKLQVPGLFITFVVLGFLAAHVDRTLIQQWTMAGGLGGLIQIGNVRMMIQLSREIFHDRKLNQAPAPEPNTN